MGVVKIILILALAFSSTLGAEDPEKRPTRTIARFLGLESPRPQQPPQQQQQQQPQHQQQVFSNIPFVYNVKYYDRAGENPEVQVEQAQVPQQQVVQQPQQQVGVQDRFMPSTRVFLNLYTGQQTPVYYDSKGQLYVPCPAYDHQVQTGVPKQVGVHVPAQKNVGPQPQPVVYNNPVVPPQAEFVYYGGVPPQQQQQQQQQQQHKQIPQQRPPGVGVGPPVVPYVSQVPVPVVPEVLYYANPPQQQQQQQQQKVVGYPPSSTVVTYNPYEVPYAYVPTPYGYPGVVNPGHVGHVVYQNGQGGYVNPFVYVKPAQVTVPPGQPVPVHAHVHTHPQGPVPTQQTDQVSVVVEKKNVSEKTEGQ